MLARLLSPALLLTLAAPPALAAQELVGGVHAGGPVRASVAVGVAWPSDPSSGTGDAGPLLLAEPGLRGHRISAGWARSIGSLGSFASARATLLELRRGERRRYAGLELQLAPLLGIGARLGGFVPLGSEGDRRVLLIGDVGFGL